METIETIILPNTTVGMTQEETYKFAHIGNDYAFNDDRGGYRVARRDVIKHKGGVDIWSLKILLKPHVPGRPDITEETPIASLGVISAYLKAGDLIIGYKERDYVVVGRLFQRNTETGLFHSIISIAEKQP